jgi:hypothetical protein
MNQGNRGQALAESLFVIPLAMAVVNISGLGFLYLSTQYLVDHWLYQSALCIAERRPPYVCKDSLSNNLQMLPWQSHHIRRWQHSETTIELELEFTLFRSMTRRFQQNLHLPLLERDFL